MRLADEPPAAEPDADVEVLPELLPHAASVTAAATAASGGVTRSARRRVLFEEVMSSFRGGVDQPPPAEPVLVAPVPVVLAPESLTDVAARVPLEFLTP